MPSKPKRAQFFSRRRRGYADEPDAGEIDDALADLDLADLPQTHGQMGRRKRRSGHLIESEMPLRE